MGQALFIEGFCNKAYSGFLDILIKEVLINFIFTELKRSYDVKNS